MGSNKPFHYCGLYLSIPKTYDAYTKYIPYSAKPGTSHDGRKPTSCPNNTPASKGPPRGKPHWWVKRMDGKALNYPWCNKEWIHGYWLDKYKLQTARMRKYVTYLKAVEKKNEANIKFWRIINMNAHLATCNAYNKKYVQTKDKGWKTLYDRCKGKVPNYK